MTAIIFLAIQHELGIKILIWCCRWHFFIPWLDEIVLLSWIVGYFMSLRVLIPWRRRIVLYFWIVYSFMKSMGNNHGSGWNQISTNVAKVCTSAMHLPPATTLPDHSRARATRATVATGSLALLVSHGYMLGGGLNLHGRRKGGCVGVGIITMGHPIGIFSLLSFMSVGEQTWT